MYRFPSVFINDYFIVMNLLFVLMLIVLTFVLLRFVFILRLRTCVLQGRVVLDSQLYFSRHSREGRADGDMLYGSLLIRIEDMHSDVQEVLISRIRFLDPHYRLIHFSPISIPRSSEGEEAMRSVSFSCSDPDCLGAAGVHLLMVGELVMQDGARRRFIARERALLQSGDVDQAAKPVLRPL